MNSLAAAIAPFLGGVLADMLAGGAFTVSLEFTQEDVVTTIPTIVLTGLNFLFILAFLIGLYAIHRLSLVEEEGDVDERVVIAALLSEARADVIVVRNLR